MENMDFLPPQGRLEYFPTYVHEPYFAENMFIGKERKPFVKPTFASAEPRLPKPFWGGHQNVIDCYWKVWQIAFQNIKPATRENGFVSHYIDTAFNNHTFMWDSVFITLFASYGSRAFDFQATLDNFYAKQHPDGFICREIDEDTGLDVFQRFDPAATGPNLLPWSEWENFMRTGDQARLAAVFPPLLAYYRWFRTYRTWRDGTYWASGWACGMDNQPRLDEQKYNVWWSHGHMVWVDTCLQQIFVNRILRQMAAVLGREADTAGLAEEAERLVQFCNQQLWDEESGFYYDLDSAGCLVPAKSIGAYWSLLANVVPAGRVEQFLAHLESENEFKRPHRVPSLSADHPAYEELGGYWRGGVWAPTNYMVLRGLTNYGQHALAYEIARNHLDNVVRIFEQTGTVWENYAPEKRMPGDPAKPDFVGWTGVPPVAVLFEYVFGLRPDAYNKRLVWDVRLLEEHGVERYPFGNEGQLELSCPARASAEEKPAVKIRTNIPLTLELHWQGGSEVIAVQPGENVG